MAEIQTVFITNWRAAGGLANCDAPLQGCKKQVASLCGLILAADDRGKGLDHHAQNTNAQGNAQGNQVNREKAIHDLRCVLENAAEIKREAKHMYSPPFFCGYHLNGNAITGGVENG